MPRNPNPDLQIVPSAQISFAGGINTSSAYDRLAEDECIDIKNMRFGEDDSLVARRGTYMQIDKIAAANITDRITSVYQAQFSDGTTRDIFTLGGASPKIYEDVAGVATDRTGALTLPTNSEFWQWKMFTDLAIGVNRGTGANTNPVKIASGAGNAAALGGTPPKAKYIEVWANRVWLTGATNATKNTLYGSVLGNAEDWTTGSGTASGTIAIDIDPSDGDFITGIISFRERLFVFKRNKIYTVDPIGGGFPTDATALSVNLYTSSIGCASAYSIQPVLDDVLFLSDHGVASLVSSQVVGDFNSALLSRKIKELRDLVLPRNKDLEISAFVVQQHAQYWLFRDDISKGTMYVLDYRRIQERIVRWTTYGNTIGAADVACLERIISGTVRTRIRIAGNSSGGSGIFGIYTYELYPETSIPFTTFNDRVNGVAATELNVVKTLQTRLIDCGLPFMKKEFSRIFFDFIAILVQVLNATPILVSYRLDNDFTKTGSWTFTIPDPSSTSVGYQSLSQLKENVKLKYNSFGSRGTSIDFVFSCSGSNQAFGIKGFTIFFAPLHAKGAKSPSLTIS